MTETPPRLSEILDASVWVGQWPFRPVPANLDGLEQELTAHGITGACVACVDAILAPEPQSHNVRLLRSLQGRPSGFGWIGAGVIDPTQAGWRDDVRECLAAGARCLKIVPNYHAYSLIGEEPGVNPTPWSERMGRGALSELDALCQIAATHGVPVAIQMRMQDERAHHPLMKVPAVPAAAVAHLAARHRESRFLVCGAYMSDLRALSEARNVRVETSLVEGLESLPQALAALGSDRVLFGSHSPLLYTLAGRVKLDAAGVEPEGRDAVAAGNWRQLLAQRS